ncbi:ABC transporter substrate-binding protein [Georgenia sp. Z1344]|uniref:ABC transporter substrate-binding protein n=1 Tax=Georgenia sp. Z1344 TaxID=3416706 RepID=UPI003CEC3B8F
MTTTPRPAPRRSAPTESRPDAWFARRRSVPAGDRRSGRRAPHAALLAAALLAACGDSGGGGEDGADGDTLTIGLTYVPDVQFAPFYVAEERGYFEDEGVEVELRHHGASEGLFTAAEAGEEDVVVAGGDEMLQAVAQGAGLTTVATMYQEYPVAILAPQDSGLASLEDLSGSSVGVPGEFGETWFGLQAALASMPDGGESVEVETIGFTQVSALTAGHVDAVVGYVNNDAVSLERAGTPVTEIPLGDDVPLVGVGLVATDAALSEREEEVAAVVRAVLRAMDDVVADPEAAVDVSATHVPDLTEPEARESALAVATATAELYGAEEQRGEIDVARWRSMAEFMSGAGLLEGEVDAEAAVRALPDTPVLVADRAVG